MGKSNVFTEIENFTDLLKSASFPPNSICFNLVNRLSRFGFILTIHLSSMSTCGNDGKPFSNSFNFIQGCFVKTLDYLKNNPNEFEMSHDGRDDGDTIIVVSSYKNPEFEYKVLSELRDGYRERELSIMVEYNFESIKLDDYRKLDELFDKFSLHDYRKKIKTFSEFQGSSDWLK